MRLFAYPPQGGRVEPFGDNYLVTLIPLNWKIILSHGEMSAFLYDRELSHLLYDGKPFTFEPLE